MMKKLYIILLTLSLPLLMGSTQYSYSFYDDVLHAAPGMTYATYFNATRLDAELRSPEDLTVFDDVIYMVDSSTNMLTMVDSGFNLIDQIDTFELSQEYEAHLIALGDNDPQPETLNSPLGLDVRSSGIYIADTSNYRIVKLNHDYEVLDIFDHVDDVTFDEMNFEPRKITVDVAERMYVVARNVYEGIIELDSDGTFNRFTGVNPIQLNPLEVFRRSLMTEAQLAQLQRYLPTEYTNVDIDHRGFIYATSRPSEGSAENMIQLINPKGIDVLRRTGYHRPMGDVHFIEGENNYVTTGPSLLVDIAYTNNGMYTVLDQRRSRLFTYDREGNLLYINGDQGTQSDKFREGVAIDYLGDDLLLLDRRTRTVIVYQLTDVGRAINQATAYHDIGEWEQAAELWREVLRLNTNYEIAYNGIGKYHLRNGEYAKAVEYFELGHDSYYYSKAFQAHRNGIITDNFNLIMLGIVLLTSTGIGLKIRKVYKAGGSIMYDD